MTAETGSTSGRTLSPRGHLAASPAEIVEDYMGPLYGGRFDKETVADGGQLDLEWLSLIHI